MNLRIAFAALAIGLFAGVAIADDDEVVTTTEESTTIEGEVMQVEPGRTIVLKKHTGDVVTFQLSPEVELPGSVAVGETVVIYTDRPASKRVTRVTTSSMGPFTKRVEERTDEFGNVESTTTYTVKSFEPGRRITVVAPSGKTLSFDIDEQSDIPTDVEVGSNVTIMSDDEGDESPLARRVTVTKKTTTTTEEEDD